MSHLQKVLVIGAGSGIARALIDRLVAAGNADIVAVQRAPDRQAGTPITEIECDYSQSAIEAVCQNLSADGWIPERIYICNGVLHGEGFSPEKQLAAVDEKAWLTVAQANALVPMLWLQKLVDIMPRSHSAKVVLFSARVGSITDNRLGGWYSYRASKAALNMMVKTAAIELKRTHRQVAVMLFHPGTTDTRLSRPFQKNVREGKLFTPDFVAERVMDVLEQHAVPGDVAFRDWAGEPVAW